MPSGPSFHRMTNKAFFATCCASFAVFSAFSGYMYFQSRPFTQPIRTGTVPGRIERIEKVSVPDPVVVSGIKTVYFELEYRYEVGGKAYVGTRVDPRDDGPVPAARLFQIERPESGSPVRVYFNPADPGDAVLVPVNRIDRLSVSIVPSIVSGALAALMGLIALRISNRWGSRDWIENG